ncbi:MAG: hypothetical protein AAGI17_03050 [Planctomycetota bacterium]
MLNVLADACSTEAVVNQTALLASSEEVVPIVAIGGGILVAIVAIIFGSVKKMVMSRNVEESRREIAAYVAEGSITPEDAKKILESEPKSIRDA